VPRILVVDDHAVTREPLAKLLRYEGFETASAANGAEALLAMYEQPADLVLLDLMMPRMDGLDFLTKLRGDARFAEIPVILMTAVPDSARLEAAKRLARTEVIQKARFDLPELLTRIQGALADGAPPSPSSEK
jgi:CheY-like chemotaxis protein